MEVAAEVAPAGATSDVVLDVAFESRGGSNTSSSLAEHEVAHDMPDDEDVEPTPEEDELIEARPPERKMAREGRCRNLSQASVGASICPLTIQPGKDP